MTVEELLEKVNEKTDTTKLKSLSKKTIEEELNDVLDEMGDDEEANDKIVTKLANRLKRMDGNLHKNVSDELKKTREEAERREKEGKSVRSGKKEEYTDGGKAGVSSSDDKYDKLLAKLEALEEANAERLRREARSALSEKVKNGLKAKFEKAGLELNDFFLENALSKLEMPDGDDADVADLVSKAENIYTVDYQRATGSKGIPKRGTLGHGGADDADDDNFVASIAKRRKARFGEKDDDGKR